MPGGYTRLTKRELIAKLERLEREVAATAALRRSVVDLQMRNEELRVDKERFEDGHADLVHEQRQYGLLFHNAPFAYFVLDERTMIAQINDAAAKLLGVDVDRLVGTMLATWVHGSDTAKLFEHLRRCRRSDDVVRTQLRLHGHDGAIVAVELYSTCAVPGNLALLGSGRFPTAAVDISKSLEWERQRHQAEEERYRLAVKEQAARTASESKDRFLAVLSHELRTPLTPILNAATKLEQSDNLPEEVRVAVEMIHRNAELQTRLIDDLLEMTRSMEGRLHLDIETVDVHAIVREVVEAWAQQASARRMSIRLDLGARRHFVRADRSRLHQVLANLVHNAIEHSGVAGEITVGSSNPSESHIHLCVVDEGVGIADRDLERIFDAFEQVNSPGRRSTGLGLGLAIAKSLIEAHGGWIRAHSAGPGTGARFVFELETTEAPPMRPVRKPTSDTAPKPTGACVLIVEDHVDTATSLAELLHLYGYRTRLAHSFESALAAAGEDFDVIISDIALPDGSGLELMRTLHESRGVEGIALSGFGSETDVVAARRAGFKEHITKPADVRRLLAALERVTRQRRREGSSSRGH